MSLSYELLDGETDLDDFEDLEDLEQALAEDDDDDFYEDDDDDFVEDDDDDDAEFAEDDDERRRFRRRFRRRRFRRRPRRIRIRRVASRRRRYVPRRPTRRPATRSDLSSSMSKVGSDIRKNAAAIKSLASQVNRVTKDLGNANRSQDSAIANVRSAVKKNSKADASRAQMNMLLPLLQKGGELEVKPNLSDTDRAFAQSVLDRVQVKKSDDTTTLALLMMTMGQSGGAGNSMGNLLPLILLMDK